MYTTGIPAMFLNYFLRNKNCDSCEKRATGTGKHRNPEDSCRNYQPRTAGGAY
jgi:hypothetical protein